MKRRKKVYVSAGIATSLVVFVVVVWFPWSRRDFEFSGAGEVIIVESPDQTQEADPSPGDAIDPSFTISGRVWDAYQRLVSDGRVELTAADRLSPDARSFVSS